MRLSVTVIRFAALLFCFSVVSVNAQMTVKKYQDWVKAAHDNHSTEEARTAEWYLDGIGQGLQMMNSWLKVSNQRPVYCTPAKLALKAENYRDLVDSFVVSVVKDPKWRSGDDPADMPIQQALLLALMDAFPCEKEAKP